MTGRRRVAGGSRCGRPGHPEAGSLLLRGGRLLDVFTGDIAPRNVLLHGGMVLEVGPRCPDAARTVDLDGAVILPGFIDGHIHLESSLLTPGRFAEAVVPRGTTTVVADPHEIANVLGLDGVRWMLAATARLPLDVMLMAPSCVPASTLETAAARLDAGAIGRMLRWRRVLGLAEVMDVPGVLARAPGVMRKIALARRRRRPVDGHAPGLCGAALDRYVAAGIASDHECVTAGEARAKLARVVDAVTVRRCLLVTDDRNAADLVRDGHVDHLLRVAVAHGIPPLWAVQMVTLNAAEHAGLAGPGGVGAIAPGWQADAVVVVDRHTRSGRVGRGLVRGFGLARGALASSVAHDAHNLVAVGVDDLDLLAALSAVESSGVGLAVAAAGAMLARLPLPIAGLMSDASLAETVGDLDRLEAASRSLGGRLAHPFGALSFLALPVVPALRLTDRGLVDVARGTLVPLVAG